MKCPFLEEVVVRYCKAYPVRKLIPSDVSSTVSLCTSDEYVHCPEYREVAMEGKGKLPEAEGTKAAKEENMSAIGRAVEKAPSKEPLCIWAKLGVIPERICTLNYNCAECEFNRSLMEANGKYAEAPEMFNAIERLRKLPASQRKCKYTLMGEVSYKLCPHNYQCGSCEYDQLMQDAIYGHPKVLARMAQIKRIEVRDFLILSHLYFYPKHTWVRIMDEKTVRVGLDDFAQRLLGRIEGVDFFQGKKLRQGEFAWGVKCKMGEAQLLSPIDGLVKRRNEELYQDSSSLNADPYDKGWVLELEPFNINGSLEGLLQGEKAKGWLAEEVDRLSQRFERDIGVTVADGGELIHAIDEKIDVRRWRALIEDFL